MRDAVIVGDGLAALGLVRSLARHGVPCTVCTWSGRGPARYATGARAAACPPPGAGRETVDALLRLRDAYAEAPVLFATNEAVLLFVDHWRDALAAAYRLTLPAPGQLATLHSKRALYATCAAAGVPAPATWPIDTARAAGASVPLVLKPDQRVLWDAAAGLRSFRHAFGRKAMLVRDWNEAQRAAAAARALGFDMLAQEWIGGAVNRLETVGAFRAADGRHAAFTARKLAQVPADFGDGAIVEATPLPDLETRAWRLLDAMSYAGIADLEFKRDAAGGVLLLDVNPRPWAWIELGTRCGVNLPYLAYCEASGRAAPDGQRQRSTAAYWSSPRGLLRTLPAALTSPSQLTLTLAHAARATRDAVRHAELRPFLRRIASSRFWTDSLRAVTGGDGVG